MLLPMNLPLGLVLEGAALDGIEYRNEAGPEPGLIRLIPWDRARHLAGESADPLVRRALAELLAAAESIKPAGKSHVAPPQPAKRAGMVEISGNTYPVRDKLKAMGGFPRKAPDGSWVWMVPGPRADEAAALVADRTAARKGGPTEAQINLLKVLMTKIEQVREFTAAGGDGRAHVRAIRRAYLGAGGDDAISAAEVSQLIDKAKALLESAVSL